MLKVCKFGGTSCADEFQFKKVKDIILQDPSREIVVVSAPGKRSASDYKITDLLFLTHSHIKYKVDYTPVFNQIKERYKGIAKALKLDIDLDREFDALEAKMKSGIKEEELVSRGEYFSALLMAKYLGYTFVDSKDIIHFTYEGKIDVEKTSRAVQEVYNRHGKMVVPGFYGAYPNGSICLFSRGGSDVTGSYLAKALKVSLYENWTDVSGILMTDPKIVPNPRKIKEVSYAELRELSYLGASVLHEETIFPIAEERIPINILNTNKPEEEGTLIKRHSEDKSFILTGITGKKNFIALTFVKKNASSKLDVMLQVLNVFKKFEVPVEHVPTSIDSFSIVCEKTKIEDRFYDIVSEIRKNTDIISISQDDDIALVAVVGQNMVKKAGISGRILSTFGKNDINIKLIAQGREELNIIVGISNKDFNKSIQALYNDYAFEKVD